MRLLLGLILCIACANCEIFPECNGKPSRYYIASYRKNDCRSFIYCNEENSFEGMCSLGLAFNPLELTCGPEENVDCYNDIKMNSILSPINSPSIRSKKRIVLATTKQHPTPPGKIGGTTPKRNSNRPVTTREQLGSITFGPRPTPKPVRTSSTPNINSLISTTRKNTNHRPSPVPTNGPPPVPTRGTKKTSSAMPTKSPIHVPTPPGPQNFPNQSKKPVLTTLPNEKQSTRFSTETTLNFPSTTNTEFLTSSAVTNNIPANIQEQCNKKSVGSFADPDNCRKYYRCVGGVLIKQECPKRFGWDAKSKMCTSKGCLNAK